MKKLLFFILAITIILTVFSISVFAEGEYDAQTDGSTEASVVTEIEEKNIFSELYGVVARHADKIFSALAFLGSLIIAFAYRHGLLPVIKGALSAMGAATSKLKEETEAASGKAAEAVSAAAAKLATAEEMLSALTKKLDGLTEELDKAREDADSRGKFKIILSSQIDMLYEIFMSSSLPQFQKEAVGNRITDMRKQLATCDANAKDGSHE